MDHVHSFLQLLDETARSGHEESLRATLAFLEACQNLMTARIRRLTDSLRGEEARSIESFTEEVQRIARRLLEQVPKASTASIVPLAAANPADTVIQDFLYQLATLADRAS